MKSKLNPNYPSVPFLICIIFAGALLLAFGACVIFLIHGAVITGQVPSPAVILGFHTMVYKSSSPIKYWTYIVFYMLGNMSCFCAGLWGPVETIVLYKKKLARQKEERGAQQQQRGS
jgi:hypothetical protein